MTFLDAGKPIAGCRNQAVGGQSARCTIRYVSLAKHHIAVSYGGDGNFTGSGSSTSTVTVSPSRPTGYVTSYMTWTFYDTRSYTNVRGLVVSGLSPAISVSVSCGGHACPFARHTTVVPTSRCVKAHRHRCARPKPVNLTSLFRGRPLAIASRITVMIAHPHWLGKYYRFTIRSGNKPRIMESCLAVGSTRPGAGCS